MQIKLVRHQFGALSTVGQLFVNNKFVCHILEDTVRDLNQDGDNDDKGEGKIYGSTAIPYGTYPIVLEKTGSIYETYKKASYWVGRGYPGFENVFKGMLMLKDGTIKGFGRVHIHIGNYIGDTLGCLLTGTTANLAKDPYSVSGSTAAYVKLYKLVIPALLAEEEVTIEIVKA